MNRSKLARLLIAFFISSFSGIAFASDPIQSIKGFKCLAENNDQEKVKIRTLFNDAQTEASIEVKKGDQIIHTIAQVYQYEERPNTRLSGFVTFEFKLPDQKGWFRITINPIFLPLGGSGWSELDMSPMDVKSGLDCKIIGPGESLLST